jgi:putative endonuclease
MRFRDSEKSKPTKAKLGEIGESEAVNFLISNRYRIVATNFLAPLGRSFRGRPITGEIDIIAYDEKNVLRFIEVKTRSSTEISTPESAVDLTKQRKIIKTARIYRRIFRLTEDAYGYDVVSVIEQNKSEYKVELLSGYFHETRFTKSRWFRS